MKKKITAIVLCIAMLAIAITGGTLAYFTDTDSRMNVMTTGKVDISQNEQQLGENGQLEPFTQNKPLMPMVDNRGADDPVVVNGYFNEKMNNVVDKIVTAKNEAAAGAVNQDAYVRTIIAFETAPEYVENTSEIRRDSKTIFNTYFGTLKHKDFQWLQRDTVKVGGVEYVVGVVVYPDTLGPQQETEPALKQFFLSPDANNEVALLFGDQYNILALTQATQVAGFEPVKDADGNVTKSAAAVALDTAFGNLEDIPAATLAGWLSACQTP